MVEVPNPSETVRKYTGTPSVSEAAAILAAGADQSHLIIENTSCAARTGATPPSPLRGLPHERFRNPDQDRKIMLVGLGPGSHDHLTARAGRRSPRPTRSSATLPTSGWWPTFGQGGHQKSMTEELDRAIEALDRASRGQEGGPHFLRGRRGVGYGRADLRGAVPGRVDAGFGYRGRDHSRGLGLEYLRRPGRAPLTHDFCAISLSDLLTPGRPSPAGSTPWPTPISSSPSTTPKSGRRTQQIVEAQRLFLRHRDAQTPVAIVKSGYRPKQRIEFTTLDRMAEADIGMLTTVLIGNSNTFIKHGLMVTPRGYANKYAVEAGERNTRPANRRAALSTGLNGWMAQIQASGRSAADLAAEPPAEDYIAAVLATPVPEVGEANEIEA